MRSFYSEHKSGIRLTAIAVVAIVLIMLVWPWYKVWKLGMDGQARLAEAEQSKRIQIETAKAELDSARYRAEAIAVVGKAAKEYPEYRQQEYIAAFGEALKEGKMEQIIYVPTEANIPIMEAGRMAKGE